jgi:uncharacterized protein (DUF362 family)
MPKVIIRKTSYNYEILKPLVFEMLDEFAGRFIRRDSRILVKPNLLSPASPDKAMLTHPMMIKATVEYVLQKGARPQISDSPALGAFEKVLQENGIKSALGGLDVEYREFKKSLSVNIGPPFHDIEIAEDSLNSDVVINLPKLKTHSQMLDLKNPSGTYGQGLTGKNSPCFWCRSIKRSDQP